LIIFSETHVLTDDQNKWVEKTETRIYDLIGETPPFGKQFGDSVKHILHREEQWNLWKNQGCPSLAPKSQLKDESNGTSNTFKKVLNVNENSIFSCVFRSWKYSQEETKAWRSNAGRDEPEEIPDGQCCPNKALESVS
jgi:hypothetical protein